MITATIRYEIEAITNRLNHLNGNDNYRFVAIGRKIFVRDVEIWVYGCDGRGGGYPEDSDTEINPMFALEMMERATGETRNYGMPFIVLG
jgi:hypothetical protein